MFISQAFSSEHQKEQSANGEKNIFDDENQGTIKRLNRFVLVFPWIDLFSRIFLLDEDSSGFVDFHESDEVGENSL